MNTDSNLPGFMEGNIQPSSPSSLIAVWCIWALRDVSGSHRPTIKNKKMKVTPFKKRASEQLDEKGYSCLQFWNWTALFQRNSCFKVTKQRKLTHDLFFLKEIMIFHFYLEMTWPALEVSPFKPNYTNSACELHFQQTYHCLCTEKWIGLEHWAGETENL